MRALSLSGGKDSVASLLLCLEKGIKLDAIIYAEIMFDRARKISAEYPDHEHFLKNTLFDFVRKETGIEPVVLPVGLDYCTNFYTKRVRGQNIGSIRGFPIAMRCPFADMKIREIEKYCKKNGITEQIVGIAADERKRIKKMKPGRHSVLNDFTVTEKQAFEICRKKGLLSPAYATRTRLGCWFCPNQNLKGWFQLFEEYPQLFEELKKMAESDDFKKIRTKNYITYNRTFEMLYEFLKYKQKLYNIFEI